MNSAYIFLKSYKNVLLVLSSIVLGIFAGIILGDKATILAPFGDIFINLMFTIVTPLIFFTVSSSVTNIITLRSTKKTLIYSILIFISMSIISTVFMIFCIKFFYPLEELAIKLPKSTNTDKINVVINFASMFTSSDFNMLLSKNSILALIVFSCIFGVSTRMLNENGEKIKSFLNIGSSVMYKMINVLMYYAPFGLFACFASYFGESTNKNLLSPMITTLIFFYVVSLVFILIFYSIYTYISAGKQGIKSLKYLLIPTTVALGTQSSLAALPSSLESAKKINIPQSIYNLTLPLGSIIHMDGSSMAAVLKIVFLCIMFNIPMVGFNFYCAVFVFSIFICLLNSGIPSGGLILETSLIAFYGLPAEVLPVLILLNYMIDPIVTVINSSGNIISSMVVSRIIKGSGWIYKREIEEIGKLKIYK